MSDQDLKITDAINHCIKQLEAAELYFGHGTENAVDEAVWLVLSALGLPPEVPDAVFETRLLPAELASVEQLLQQRIETRKPLAYLIGVAWFCGLKFFVNEDVLVPRSPLAEQIIHGFEPWRAGVPVHSVLDIGTGSGCIAIACAWAFPEAVVDAADISIAALQVTERNISHHQLSNRVSPVESDLFSALVGRHYDIIVSNPPYVDAEDMSDLPEEYRFEPELGLASGPDGLDHVRRIMAEAGQHLNPDGMLIVEVGNSADALVEAFPYLPFTWLEFEHGGHGVFMLHREYLCQ